MLPTPPASPKPSGLCTFEDRRGHVLAGRIQMTDVLGVGAYGTVYKARDIQTGTQYAVKALNKVDLDARQRKFQQREIQLHHLASRHSNVVSMEKILDTPTCTYVILEYCPEGDLFSRITEAGDYVGNEEKAKSVFLQILDAVQHCHSQGIYHRDLKPENILVQDQGRTVKLADFGLATQSRVTSDFGCGSTFYMSPECQQSNPKPFSCYASAPNDIWSLGVVLVNLTCGRNPWKRASMEDSTFRAYVRERNFLKTILPISDSLNSILKRIFEVDPRRRISLDELRTAIQRCTSFGQSTATTLPPSPPYSPVESPIDSPASVQSEILEPVPNIDLLPAQQYPQPPQSTLQTTPFPQVQRPIPKVNSPQAAYNYSPTAVTGAQAVQFSQNQPGLVPASFASWSRYSNFVPNMAAQSCWRNVPVL